MAEPAPRSLQVRVLEGGPIQKPVEPFVPVFGTPDCRSAAELRRKYGLMKVAGKGSDFERARRLKIWVRRQWNHGYDQLDGPQDALSLLAAARRGLSFACGHYAQTFMECCLAVGLPARRVGIRRFETDFPHRCRGNHGHCVAEVYCRGPAKWVLMDADVNGHYVIGDTPASALDLHRAWLRNRGRGVRLVLAEPRFVVPESCPGFTRQEIRFMFQDFSRHSTLPFYRYISTALAHGLGPGEAADVPNRMLFFADEIHPYLARDFQGNPFGFATLVTREEQFNWPIDRTFMQARMVGKRPSRRVEIRLQHTMPFFHHFELAVGRGTYTRLRSDTKTLSLPDGRTATRARCVDTFGKSGHEARLRFEVRRRRA